MKSDLGSLAAPSCADDGASARRNAAWIAAAGLGAMYGPTFVDLFQQVWNTDQQGHGPIVLAISLWLLYRKSGELKVADWTTRSSAVGWGLLAFALVLYVVGRSQAILLFDVGSLIVSLCAVTLILAGGRVLKAIWFPLFFMAFMVPLPSTVVDAVTMPMKMAVSNAAEFLLDMAGYPIARAGVILQIGQYQLLVADACAGLHTLFTLEALGLLYLNLMRHESFVRNTVLAILIVPISFCANVIRVIVLTLITYYWGDEAGQGFLHGFAGMVLFLSALLLIVGVDSVLRVSVRSVQGARPGGIAGQGA